jgi:acetylglutamate kinase
MKSRHPERVQRADGAPASSRVIKLGGSLLDDAQRRDTVLREIARAWHRGEQLVIVHGGGKHIDAALATRGIARKTHAGLRITDDVTLEIVIDVLDHVVNPLIVNELLALGVNAEGISGASILIAEKHPPIDGIDLLNVGRVIGANTIECSDTLPVISCVAAHNGAPASAGHGGAPLLNVNADSAAAAVAVAMKADSLQFITDVAGLLDENGAVVSSLHANAVEEWIDNVTGGMKPKLQAALHALQNGVSPITIGCHPELVEGSGRPGGTLLTANFAAPHTRPGASLTLGVTNEGEPNVAA